MWLGADWVGEQLLWASDGALVSDGYTNWKGAAVELSCVKKESADRGSQWSLSSCFATLNVVCETPDPKDYAFDCKIAIAYTCTFIFPLLKLSYSVVSDLCFRWISTGDHQ